MTVEIKDKPRLFQWDVNQILLVDPAAAYVDFSGEELIRVEAVNGEARIPDEWLQKDGLKTVWVCWSDNTRTAATVSVRWRPMPPSYVYTPTQKVTFDSLVERVNGTVDDMIRRRDAGEFNGADYDHSDEYAALTREIAGYQAQVSADREAISDSVEAATGSAASASISAASAGSSADTAALAADLAASAAESIPADYRTLAATVSQQQFDIDNLKAAAEGYLYREYVDASVSSYKDVPAEALPGAILESVAGNSVRRDGTIVSSDAETIDTGLALATIPDVLRALPGYGWAVGDTRNELDLVLGLYTQRVAEATSETVKWTQYTAQRHRAVVPGKAPGNFNVICDAFPTSDKTSIASMADGEVKGSPDGNYLFLKDSNRTLGDIPFRVLFELETPIVTNLSDLLPAADLRSLSELRVEPGGQIKFAGPDGSVSPASVIHYLIKIGGAQNGTD